MRTKKAYIQPNGLIDRQEFNIDIRRHARDNGISLANALKEFFAQAEFSNEEKGKFALYTSTTANLVDSGAVLIHALGITEEEARSPGVLKEYFGARVSDPTMWGASWILDSVMNWPPGTSMPESKHALYNL